MKIIRLRCRYVRWCWAGRMTSRSIDVQIYSWWIILRCVWQLSPRACALSISQLFETHFTLTVRKQREVPVTQLTPSHSSTDKSESKWRKEIIKCAFIHRIETSDNFKFSLRYDFVKARREKNHSEKPRYRQNVGKI